MRVCVEQGSWGPGLRGGGMEGRLNGRRGEAARLITETLRVEVMGADKGQDIRVGRYEAGGTGTWLALFTKEVGPRSCNLTLRLGRS